MIDKHHLTITAGYITCAILSAAAHGETATWDAGGLVPYWSTPENWVGDVAPANDGTADINFITNPPATPILIQSWSIHSLNMLDATKLMSLSGDTLTIGAGGFNATPIGSYNTPTLIWNNITLSAAQTWQNTLKYTDLAGDFDAGGYHLTINNTGRFTFLEDANFSGGLTKLGSGTLYFDNTPTASNGVSMRAGVLSIPSPITGGVQLSGGALETRGDWDVTDLLASNSISGDLIWSDVADITFGGTNLLDFATVGASGPVRMGASVDSSISASVVIIPDPASRTLHFGAGDAELTVNSNLTDSAAGPTHLTFSGSGTTILNGSNTYTGITTISGGVVEANTPTAFGTTNNPTTVTGGDVLVNATTSEAFIVEGGTLQTSRHVDSTFNISGGTLTLVDPYTMTFDNVITMSGGTLNYRVDPNNTGIVTSPITVEGGGRVTIGGYASYDEVHLAGPITGDGSIALQTIYTHLVIDSSMSHTGDTIIYHDSKLNETWDHGVYFESTQSFGGDLIIERGFLVNNAPNTVPNLIMIDGRVQGSAPLTVLNPILNLPAGEINIPGGLVGITDIRKITMDEARLMDFGTQINPTVTVEAGRLVLGKAAGEAADGPVTILTNAQADIAIDSTVDVAVDIQLNNGKGISYSGALTNDEVGRVSGTIYLGDQGAYIGGIDTDGYNDYHYLRLSGRITGGDLTKVGANRVVIAGANNDYTGETTIVDGVLHITDGGQLTTTSSINIRGDGVLRLDDGTLNSNWNHIGDDIPIHMHNGIVELISPINLPVYEETFGVLNLDRGGAVFVSDQESYGTATPQIVTFDRIRRQWSATVAFQSDWGRMGVVDGAITYKLLNTPTLNDGIIGGWAVTIVPGYNEVDFVTYDPVLGISPLSATGRPSDINTAGAADNVMLSGDSIMTADRTINSLHMNESDLDLGGHKLTIDSGGMILGGIGSTPTIENGQLASGADTSELIMLVGRTNHSHSGAIYADIVDGSTGRTDLVVSRYRQEAATYIRLHGNNTYSGTTFANKGAGILVYEASAVPTMNDLVLNGGYYNILIDSGEIQFGDIWLRDDAELVSQNYNGLSAGLIFVESGSIRADLHDFTSLIKTSTGVLTIGYANNDQYQEMTNSNAMGYFDFHEGIVVVQPTYGFGNAIATVHDGARLVLDRRVYADDSIMHGNIDLEGGELAAGYKEDLILQGSLGVISDSTILTNYGLAGLDYSHSAYDVSDPFGARHITLDCDTWVWHDVTLTAKGSGSLTIIGNLEMAPGSTIAGNVLVKPSSGNTINTTGTIEGNVVIGDGATAILPGNESVQLTVLGNYTQLLGGVLDITLSADDFTTANASASLSITGSTEFAGELLVSLPDGFTPDFGDQFTLIAADSLLGEFDNVTLPSLSENMMWTMLQDETSLSLYVSSLIQGDLNDDGFVGLDDLDIVLRNWNDTTPLNDPRADVSGPDGVPDGFVGLDDLDIILQHWNQGTPSSSNTNIPEPHSLSILGIGCLAMLRRQ